MGRKKTKPDTDLVTPSRSAVRFLPPVKSKGGRKRKELDLEKFKGLCSILCTKSEICGILEMHEDTLDSRIKEMLGVSFSEAWEMFAARGRVSLRRLQFTQAEKSVPMSIFLGKQYLGQSEKIQATPVDPIEQFSDDELDKLEKEITARVLNDSDKSEQETLSNAISETSEGEETPTRSDEPI